MLNLLMTLLTLSFRSWGPNSLYGMESTQSSSTDRNQNDRSCPLVYPGIGNLIFHKPSMPFLVPALFRGKHFYIPRSLQTEGIFQSIIFPGPGLLFREANTFLQVRRCRLVNHRWDRCHRHLKFYHLLLLHYKPKPRGH